MVIEQFKDRNPVPIYKRFEDTGRMMPDGLTYVGSWIEANLHRCFQLMECEDASKFQEWVAQWRDLVDFEIVPVVPSAETKSLFASLSTNN